MKKRVLIRAGYLSMRGETLSSFQLARELVERGYTIGVLSNGGPFQDRVQKMGASMVEVNELKNNLFLDSISLLREVSLVKAFAPQIIHFQSHALDRVGTLTARLTRIPYVITIRSLMKEGRKLSFSKRLGRAIIFVSEEVRQETVNFNRAPKEFTTVVPDGVENGGEPRALPEGRIKVVGTITPLQPLRGLDFFVQAAKEVLNCGAQCRFVIVGEGPQEMVLRRLIRRLDLEDYFTVAHPLTTFSDAIKGINIFVFPSLREGLGLLAMYAMAHGIPVVASSVGGILSLIADGETGLLVPSRDAGALAGKIRFLLENPVEARELGKAGRAFVLENYPLSRTVDRIEEVYDKALGGH